jgi:hypothetical protein
MPTSSKIPLREIIGAGLLLFVLVSITLFLSDAANTGRVKAPSWLFVTLSVTIVLAFIWPVLRIMRPPNAPAAASSNEPGAVHDYSGKLLEQLQILSEAENNAANSAVHDAAIKIEHALKRLHKRQILSKIVFELVLLYRTARNIDLHNFNKLRQLLEDLDPEYLEKLNIIENRERHDSRLYQLNDAIRTLRGLDRRNEPFLHEIENVIAQLTPKVSKELSTLQDVDSAFNSLIELLEKGDREADYIRHAMVDLQKDIFNINKNAMDNIRHTIEYPE